VIESSALEELEFRKRRLLQVRAGRPSFPSERSDLLRQVAIGDPSPHIQPILLKSLTDQRLLTGRVTTCLQVFRILPKTQLRREAKPARSFHSTQLHAAIQDGAAAAMIAAAILGLPTHHSLLTVRLHHEQSTHLVQPIEQTRIHDPVARLLLKPNFDQLGISGHLPG
jgi:hypothetical protein